MESVEFRVTFWGVRGSRPVPGPHTVKYGGNTPCVEITIGERLFIMDAGTGICNLGQQLLDRSKNVHAAIFITHTHWDHIQGFPFFTLAFIKGNRFDLYGQNRMNVTFADLMRGQMMYAHFPVALDQMGAVFDFHEVNSGEKIDMGDGIIVNTALNNHPGGGISYRVEYDGRSCCYVTDTEHYSIVDPHIKRLVNESDIVIYDANFTDKEYAGDSSYNSKVGWGHSTWQEGIKLVKASGAKKLVLFHHATYRTDEDMEKIEQHAREHYPDCIAAREGMIITI